MEIASHNKSIIVVASNQNRSLESICHEIRGNDVWLSDTLRLPVAGPCIPITKDWVVANL